MKQLRLLGTSYLRTATLWAAIVMFISVAPAFPQETRFILEGSGDAGIDDYGLILVVRENKARIAVRGQGCLGSMDAAFSRLDRHTWELSSIETGESCSIVLKDHGDGDVETIQGPGCSYYHGAVCGFSGHFNAPTENGLAPIFDPTG